MFLLQLNDFLFFVLYICIYFFFFLSGRVSFSISRMYIFSWAGGRVGGNYAACIIISYLLMLGFQVWLHFSLAFNVETLSFDVGILSWVLLGRLVQHKSVFDDF